MEQEPLLYLTDENGNVRPYTREELIARVEEGRNQIAMGNYTDIEILLRELDEDFEEDLRKGVYDNHIEELELAEA